MAFPFNLFAQDIINPEPLGYSTTYSQLVESEQTKFIRGWNWGSPGKNLDEVFYTTQRFHLFLSIKLMLKNKRNYL